MRIVWLVVLWATAVLIAAGQRPSGSFVVAVHQGDTVLPLARYEAGRWLNTWDGPDEYDVPVPPLAEIPESWLGGPVPTAWTLWFTTGGSRPVTITGTRRSGGCQGSPALVVHEHPTLPPDLFDTVHIGLATTEGARFVPIRLLRPTDADWRDLQPAIEVLFRAHERKAVETYPSYVEEVRERLSAERMARTPMTIDWLYRAVVDGQPVFYFEAGKRSEGDVGLRIAVSGWLRRGSSKEPDAAGVQAGVRWDELPPGVAPEVSDRVPLGVLRVPEGAVWVLEAPAGETTTYVLVEVGATNVRELLVVDAGGC